MVHFGHEHGKGPSVDAVVAVESFIYYQFFPCFGMGGDGQDFIVVVFEVVPDFSGLWIVSHEWAPLGI